MERKDNLKSKKKNEFDASQLVYGVIPPQDKEIEKVVLGAILLEKSAFDIVSEALTADCFYLDIHKTIFGAMQHISNKNQIIELHTLAEYLHKSGQLDEVGGAYYLTGLTNSVVSTAALEQHCRILLEKHMARQLIRIGGEMVGMGYDSGTDIFDYIDKAEQSIFSVSNSILKKDFQSIQNVGVEVFSRIDQLRNTPQSFTGVPSGFTDLDRITNGWQPTDLIILAARPSVGKTALALNLARNAATDPQKRTPIGFFSLEMSANQLVQRIISAESEVPLEAIKTGRVSNDQYTTLLTKGLHRLDSMNLYIDDSAALNIFEFRAKARRMVSKYKVGMIIIDYLQLMSGMRDRNGSREQEISNISRNLKAIAKDLNIPIIALSQLSRAVESRSSSKVPQLSDLRESGAIEQDADMVMFIYRPEYHGIQNNDMGESTDGLTEIKIAKHRNGALGTVQLRAELAIQKFTSIEPSFNQGSWKPVTKQTSFDDGFNEPI